MVVRKFSPPWVSIKTVLWKPKPDSLIFTMQFKMYKILTLKSFGGIRTGPGPRGPPGYRGDINGWKERQKFII